MAFVRVFKEENPLLETLAFLEQMGGPEVVKAVRLTTPANGVPKYALIPELWPAALEVKPTKPQFHHVTRIYILNMNTGYRGRGPLYTKELLETLGFQVPDVFTNRFINDRFVRESS